MKVRIESSISRKRHICTCSIIKDEFIYREIELWYGRKGFYILFPSRMYHPIKEEIRQKILNAIINELIKYPEFIRLHSDKIKNIDK